MSRLQSTNMETLVKVASLCLVLAVTSANRERRQTYPTNPPYQQQQQFFPGQNQGVNFNCQGNGQFPDPQDCHGYIRCDNGQATRMKCIDGLVFNNQNNECDWPQNSPPCQGGGQNDYLKPQFQGLCNTNTNANQQDAVFLVPHPTHCNAYLVCSQGYLYQGCQFCNGAYFENGQCRNFNRQDPQQVCQRLQKRYVIPEEITTALIDEECWVRQDTPNPWATLIAKIRGQQPSYQNPTPAYNPPTYQQQPTYQNPPYNPTYPTYSPQG